MSTKTTEEERIISLRFDNKNFEKNVNSTIQVLDKLKEKLNFKGVKDSFNSINQSAKNINFGSMEKSVEVLQAKFNALDVVAVTALSNITTAAMSSGSKIIKALTLDPIMTGFEEYETKINAVQTIMANTASKGTTMTDVTAVLDELNTYADKTIYNFAEMTRNIGTFTAAGVGLEDSASAIQGISNLAATSGSNAQQAATAMYQLSQALAAGKVQLMDWNSVVNAGMGGEKFQEALKETAREQGIAVDKMIEKNGSFRESLREGWLSADVLNTTLKKFTVEGATEYANAMMASGKYTQEQADALIANAQMMEDAATKVKTVTQLWSTLKESVQSGWAQTWELIIGDFEDAKYLLSSISDFLTGIIGRSSDARNNLLQSGLGSRWSEFTAEINKAGITTDAYTEKVKELARQNGIAIDDMIEEYGSLDKVLNRGKISSNILRDALKSFTATADGSNAKLVELRDTVDQTGSSINTMTEEMGRMTGRELLFDSLKNALQPIISILGAIGTAWRDAFPPMQGSTLYNIMAGINEFTKYLVISERNVKNITNTFRGLFALLDLFVSVVLAPLNLGFKILVEVGRQLLEAMGFVNTSILDVTGSVGSLIASFRDWYEQHSIINRVVEITANLIVGLIRNFANFIKTLYELPPVQASIVAVTKTVELLGKAIDIYFLQGAEVLHNFIENLLKMDEISLSNILGVFKTFKKEVIDYLLDFDNIPKDIMSGLAKGITDAQEKVFAAMEAVGTGILEAIKGVLEIHSPSVKMAEVGENAMLGFLNGIKNIFGTIFGVVGDFVNMFIDIFSGLALGDVFIVGSLAGIYLTLNKTLKVLDKFAAPFESIGKVFKSLSGVLDGVAGIANAKAKQIKSEAILNIAKAIALLAGSLIALSLIDQGKLWSSIAILGALVGAMAALIKVTEKVDTTGFGFGKLSVMMLSMSTSMLIMSVALKSLSKIDGASALKSLGIMASIVLAFVGVIAAYGVFVKNGADANINKVGSMMMKMSISFGILALAVKAISLLSAEDMAKAAIFITGATAIFAAMSFISKIAYNADKVSKLIMKMTISLGLLVGVAKLINLLEYGEMGKALAFMAGVGVIFGLVVALTSLGDDNIDKASKLILKMTVAIGLLAIVVRMIGGMSTEEIAKGMVVVGGVMAMFTVIMTLSKFAGKNADKAGNMLLKMSLAIGILAITIRLITDLSQSEITKGLAIIGSISVLFAAIIAVSTFAGKHADRAGNMLLKMSLAIGVLTVSMRLIAGMSEDDIKKGMKVIAGISAIFSAITLMSAIAGKIKIDTKTMAFMTVYIVALAGAVYLLAQLPIENVAGITTGLTTLITGLSVSMILLSKIKSISPSVLIGIGAVTLAISGIAAILGIMDALNVEASVKTASAISILLLSMSAACVILSGVGMTGPAAIYGIGILLALTASLGVLLTAIGGLVTQFPQLETFIDKGTEIFSKIGYALGSFVGSIAGGLIDGVSSGLPKLGKNLSEFMENLEPFIEGSSKIDKSATEGVLNLAKTILVLTGADILEGLTSWLTGGNSLEKFGKQLPSFGENLKRYADSVDGINADSVTASANAAKTLSELANNLPNSGGLAAWFAGSNNIDDFGEMLPSFGEDLKAFSDNIEGIKPENVTASANAAKTLAELANNLPNSGGLVSWFTGSNNIDEFGEKLPSFGKDLKSFSDSIEGIKPENITAAANAAKSLGEFAGALPETGGAISKLTGDEDLSAFSEQLPAFGASLKEYSIAVGDINSESIQGSVSAVKSLANMAESLPTFGGVLSWFSGEKDLAAFGEQLPSFGANLKKYSNNVMDINLESINGSVAAIDSLATLYDTFDKKGGFFSLFVGNKETLAEFGEMLPDFGTSLNTYATNVGSLNAETLTASGTAIDGIVKLLKNMEGLSTSGANAFKNSITALNETNISGFIQNYGTNASQLIGIGQNITKFISEGISSGKTQITTNISTLLFDIPNIFSANEAQFKGIGTGIINNIIAGIDENKNKPKENIKTMLDSVITGINSYYETFKTAGKHVVNGFAKGIDENTYKAEAKAKEMARAAANAAKKELDEHSPSKVFGKIGKFAGLGFVNELANYVLKAEETGKDVGAASANGLRMGLNAMTDVGMPYHDLNSSFKPILDLSGVQTEVDNMIDTFRLQLSADVIANVSSLDNMMSQNEQMNSMFDKLSSKLDSTIRSIFEEFKAEDDDKVYVIDIHLDTDGREIARTSAKYMKTEIEKIEKRNGRKGGSK